MSDSEAEVVETPELTRTRGPLRMPKVTLGLSAFLMSLTVTAINAYFALRGSEITVLNPDSVLMYKDGSGANAALGVALPLTMINTAASDYGDILMDASVTSDEGRTSFHWTSNLTPVFTSSDKAENCPVEVKCIPLPGLLVIDKGDQLADIPGGAARIYTLSFIITGSNCVGNARTCASYSDYDRALTALVAKPLNLTVTAHFASDGTRTIVCWVGTPQTDFLAKHGWTSLRCSRSSVTSDRWL